MLPGDSIRQLWSIPEPWSVQPITQGINNLTQVIETPSGSYILRAYSSDRSLEHIRYELRLLRALQRKDLSFQIAAPIPTITGELFGVFPESIVTLSPWLPGLPPPGENLEQACAAGQTLAELVAALADIEVEITSQLTPFPPSHDFEGWAGVPINPGELIQGLPLSREEQKRTLTLLNETQASAHALYHTLPQQIIHRDYDQSNILMKGNTVIGVLDFEFCGPDLRILDLTYALSQWPYGLWHTGREWSVIDAFAQAYLQQQRLTLSELEAMPRVFRLRATTSLFFRFGRYTRGLETLESMLVRIREALEMEAWLQIHEQELLRHVRSWYH